MSNIEIMFLMSYFRGMEVTPSLGGSFESVSWKVLPKVMGALLVMI